MGAHGTAPLLHGDITAEIIRLFLRVYDRLGFGYLESVYRNALAHELTKAGVTFEREATIDVWYDGICVGHFRADFLVEGRVIVEVKACETLVGAHREQVLNYLRGSHLEVGLLLHFGPAAKFRRVLYTNDRKADLRAVTAVP
ncbi:MAG: hypothetical protein JWM41_1295 [Gemmatimonadetes bacterium]|nr:hypothetical protein [Gemmatimonadota bacterium]